MEILEGGGLIELQSGRPVLHRSSMSSYGIREMKLVLVGNMSVGKTCIAKTATTGSFVDNTAPTLGASFIAKMVQVDDEEIRLQIWDTAGQERYRGMTPMYFRGAHAAIIAYSITDEGSFDGIDAWVESLRDNAPPGIELVLVGNKMDLEDERVIASARGESKATDIGAAFYEVSAKTGDRINEVFLDVATRLLEQGNSKPVPAAVPPPLELTKPQRERKKGCC
jgi:small GTP-binding protein